MILDKKNQTFAAGPAELPPPLPPTCPPAFVGARGYAGPPRPAPPKFPPVRPWWKFWG